MLEPTLPANMRHMMDEENSSSRISRVTYPTVQRGIHGLSMLSFIWMVMTAPMKNEMSSTMPMELMPSLLISLTYWRKNMFMRSGRANVRPMSCRYLPNVLSAVNMACKYLCANVRLFA